MDIQSLIDVATGYPHDGRVNFRALHALLNCFAIKLDMINNDISVYLGHKQSLGIKNRLVAGEDEEETKEEPPAEVTETPAPDEPDTTAAPAVDEPEANVAEAVQEASAVEKEEEPVKEPAKEPEKEPAKEPEKEPEKEIKSEGAPESPEEVKVESASEPVNETKAETSKEKVESTTDQPTAPDHSTGEPSSTKAVEEIDKLEDDVGFEINLSEIDFSSHTSEVKSKDETSETIIKLIEKSDSASKTDQYSQKVNEVLENWNFVLHGIITLTEILMCNKNDDEHIRRMIYLLTKLNQHTTMLSSSEAHINIEEYPEMANRTYLNISQAETTPPETNFLTEEVAKQILQNETLMFNKIDHLSTAFMERNFEDEFKKLDNLANQTKTFIANVTTINTRLARLADKTAAVEEYSNELSNKIVLLDKKKVEISQIHEILEGKPDFSHLKRKLSIVDFVQYKYFVEENLYEIARTLSSLAFRFSIIEEIREILINIKSADWVNVLKSQFEKDINSLRKEIMDIIEEKQVCGTLGIPLVCNMTHSLSAKKDDKCSSEMKKNYYIPSLDEIEKACAKRLSAGGQPFKLPPKDYVYKGTTSNMVKRSPSAPGRMKKICGKKVL